MPTLKQSPSLARSAALRRSRRIACQPVTGPNSSTAASSVLDHVQRTMHRFPFEVTRWRIGYANVNLRAAQNAMTTPVAVTGLYTGSPVFPAPSASATSSQQTLTTGPGRWVGNCSATLTQVSGAVTVPTDGTYAFTPWITNDPWSANTEKVLSWGVTSTNTGTGYSSGNCWQGASATGSGNADAATINGLSGYSFGAGVIRLSVVIEYEFAENSQVYVFAGDSNTAQYSPDGPFAINTAGAGAGCLPYESWPCVAGAMGGFVAINLGVGSTLTTDWATTYPHLWSRLPSGLALDGVIVSLGTNGLSFNTFVTDFPAINAYIRGTLGCRTIWWTTITPRAWPDGAYTDGGSVIIGKTTAGIAAGATTFTVDFAIPTGNNLVGLGPTMENVNVSSVSGPSSGVWTATTGSAFVNKHFAGEPVSGGNERARRLNNNFVRNLPNGITGAIDFEALLEASPGAHFMDDRYAASDRLHNLRGVAAVKAAAVVGTAVRPSFG